VLPLPAQGQPAGFSPNNVGVYHIEAKIDRTRVQQGEPCTLRVTLQGTGNLRLVDPGTWPEIEGLRRYEPKVETELDPGPVVGGRRSYSFLVIPERAGRITIAPHTFSFFDPQKKRYETVASEPLFLEVESRDSATTAAPAPELARASGEPGPQETSFAEILRPAVLPRGSRSAPWLSPEAWLSGMLGVPALVGLAWMVGYLRRRLEPDLATRARRQQRQHQNRKIALARAAIESGAGFFALVGQLLQELAVGYAGPEGVGQPRPRLLWLLQEKGLNEQHVAELREILDTCDLARFGAQTGGAEARRELFERALLLTEVLARGPGGGR
jgi:hypothetical protein